jgi:hypothetical protein
MDIEKFLKNPKTVEIIINSLNNVVKLPKDGFLAGGSVANMLLSLYHDGTPWRFNVNDVDIFRPTSEEIEVEGEDMLNKGITVNTELNVMDEGYGHTFIEEDGTYYKVLSSERFGLINEVKCLISHGHYGGNQERVIPEPPTDNPDKYMFSVTYNEPKIPNVDPDNDIILRGFDLNCCQAGVDLSNGVLHYTKEFVEFLKSKQVLVIIPYTPFHTSVRMVKKMKLYGDFCYCDLDYEMRYLTEAKCIDDACQFFGKENYDKFMENVDILGEYIRIEPVNFRYMPMEYKQKYFPNNLMDSLRYDDVEVSEEHKLWSYDFIKDIEYINVELDKIHLLKRVWELQYRPMKKSHVNKINSILSFEKTDFSCLEYCDESQTIPYHIQRLISNDGYYDCDFTDKHLNVIRTFVNEHRRIRGLLYKSGNIQEQYNNVMLIKRIVKQEGVWVVGVLETLGNDMMNSQTKMTEEWIYGLIEKEKKRMSTPLVEPLKLDGFKYRKYVTELTTPISLRKEGEKMGHCVGGYSSNIENGHSRIFHIEVDGIGSTLEVRLLESQWELNTYTKPNKEVVRVGQHYGRYPEKMGNQTPTNKNRGVAFKLCYFLSQQLLDKVVLSREQMYSGDKLWAKWLIDGHRGKNSRNPKKRLSHSMYNPLPF